MIQMARVCLIRETFERNTLIDNHSTIDYIPEGGVPGTKIEDIRYTRIYGRNRTVIQVTIFSQSDRGDEEKNYV